MDFSGHNYWLHEDQHEHTSLLFTESFKNSFKIVLINFSFIQNQEMKHPYNMICSPTLNPDLLFFLTNINKGTLNKDSRSVNICYMK